MADPNVERLRVVMSLFRLKQTDLCRATGFSKTYLCRLLGENDFRAGPDFWMALNNRLLSLIGETSAHVFQVDPVHHHQSEATDSRSTVLGQHASIGN